MIETYYCLFYEGVDNGRGKGIIGITTNKELAERNAEVICAKIGTIHADLSKEFIPTYIEDEEDASND